MSVLRSEAVRRSIDRVLGHFPDRIVNIKVDPQSPWVSVDVDPAWGEEVTDVTAEHKFGIWRRTGLLYPVGKDGAVGDDPIYDDDALVKPREEPTDG